MLSQFASTDSTASLLAVVFLILVGLFALAIAAFEIWMLVNVIQNKNIDTNRKLIWIVGMVLLHPFVAIGYYFTDRNKTS